MRDIRELKKFIYERIEFETTGEVSKLTPDGIMSEWVDSLGIQIILMDIEEEFCEPGVVIDEELISFLFKDKPSIQFVSDVITDYLLGFIDIEEATKEGYVYVKKHDW